MAKMGFADPASEAAPCRWVALRNGLSRGGNGHVHIVVSLVQEDGKKANTWNDRPRAQQAAGELEREFRLQVLESRSVRRGGRESTPAERGVAERREVAAAREEGRPPLDAVRRGAGALARVSVGGDWSGARVRAAAPPARA